MKARVWKVFLIILLANLSVFSSLAQANIMLDVPFFSQKCGEECDKRTLCESCSYTVSNSGCMMTSFAMILAYYGVNTNQLLFHDWLIDIKHQGYDSKGSLVWTTKVEAYANDMGFNNVATGLSWNDLITGQNSQAIHNELEAGYPVIVKVPCAGGHWMVVVSEKDGKFFCWDPLGDQANPKLVSIDKYGAYEKYLTVHGAVSSNGYSNLKSGAYIKFSNSSKVYLVFKNQLWWIKDEATFYAMGNSNFNNVKEYDSSQYNQITAQFPIAKILVDENFVAKVPASSSPAKVYMFSNGKWHWFETWDVFTAYGFTDNNIVDIPPAVFAKYSVGDSISSVNGSVQGALIGGSSSTGATDALSQTGQTGNLAPSAEFIAKVNRNSTGKWYDRDGYAIDKMSYSQFSTLNGQAQIDWAESMGFSQDPSAYLKNATASEILPASATAHKPMPPINKITETIAYDGVPVMSIVSRCNREQNGQLVGVDSTELHLYFQKYLGRSASGKDYENWRGQPFRDFVAFLENNRIEIPVATEAELASAKSVALIAETRNPQVITKRFYFEKGDGSIQSSPYPSSWSTQRNTATGRGVVYTGESTSASVAAWEFDGGYLGITRAFFSSDTSSIPDNANIVSVKFSAVVAGASYAAHDNFSYLGIAPSSQANTDKLENSDFDNAETEKLAYMYIWELPAGARKDFIFEDPSALTYISKTGYTKLCLREGHDLENNTASIGSWNLRSWSSNNSVSIFTSDASEEKRPYLEITYTCDALTPNDLAVQDFLNTSLASPQITTVSNGSNAAVVKPVNTNSVQTTVQPANLPSEITKKIYPILDGFAGTVTGQYPVTWEVQHNIEIGKDAYSEATYMVASVDVSSFVKNFVVIRRIFLLFDTSLLPDNANIVSAKFCGYVQEFENKAKDAFSYFALVSAYQTDPAKLQYIDIGRIGADKLSENVSEAATGKYVEWKLNSAGLKSISLTGLTNFCIREGHDLENNTATIRGWNNNDWYDRNRLVISTFESVAEKRPYLEITYILENNK